MNTGRSNRTIFNSSCYRLPAVLAFFLITVIQLYAQEDVLRKKIELPQQNSTIYLLLNQISRQTGYFFIYDSDVIDSDKRVRIRKTNAELEPFLNRILSDPTLDFKIIGYHILIYRPRELTSPESEELLNDEKPEWLTLQGRVLDHETGSPLAHASVGIPALGMGVPSNTEGKFRFRVPQTLTNDSLRISYMGYKTRYLPISLLQGNFPDIRLQTDYISIQEVIIRYFDPIEIITEALSLRNQNYSTDPVYLVSFYREGVEKDSRLLNYSEAIFRVYKSPYNESFSQDQAMVLKSRNITNTDHTDTLMLKLKAGVKSSLDLDIMKNIPDFLDPDFFVEYNYTAAGLVSLDGKSVYAIEFEQARHITDPLFKGTMYIEQESMAILKAEFEINPDYIDRATERYILKKNRRLNASLQSIKYNISYQKHNGIYYLSHVRGDINLRIRNRNRIFSQTYNVFLELAVSRIETENVSRFSRREALRTNAIFAEQEFEYDFEFWGDYNIIVPENQINEALLRINSKIESLVNEN